MDSTMLLMDVISAACAAYCAYTWVRLLRERKLFKNELLLGKDKKPKASSHILDTTEKETGETAEDSALDEELSSAPMKAFEGAAQDGIGLDASVLAMKPDANAGNGNS